MVWQRTWWLGTLAEWSLSGGWGTVFVEASAWAVLPTPPPYLTEGMPSGEIDPLAEKPRELILRAQERATLISLSNVYQQLERIRKNVRDRYQRGRAPDAEETGNRSALHQFMRARRSAEDAGVDDDAPEGPNDVIAPLRKQNGEAGLNCNGFIRMKRCREALFALDRCGWQRSYHQKQFHEQYIRACSRIFFKRDPPGSFARAQTQLLEMNGWTSLSQEVLISTPRRFGKTISVSTFAAAMMFACPTMELSIYSTCKRISQKLLRNILKFLDTIYKELRVPPYRVIRQNAEELVVAGPEGHRDTRHVSEWFTNENEYRNPCNND